MNREPRNLASDRIRERYPQLSRIPEMTGAELEGFRKNYTADFVRDDRRRFVTIPAATFDEFIDSLRAYWELGVGAPRFSVAEVIAVRGDRLVLFRSRIDFDDETSTQSLVVLSFDDQMRAERGTMFDADDHRSALAELDRRHTEND